MPGRDVVVAAASAGGIEALRDLVGGLPDDYEGVVLVVLHMPPEAGSSLVQILQRRTSLSVRQATDADPLKPGTVYVCASDRHLLLGNGHVHVRPGPKENGHRPAADPLFRSAARYYGQRAVGVILSGTLSDGTAGLRSIRGQGGTTVVQDPDDALYPGMPISALEHVGTDHVLPAAEIGPLLDRLAREQVQDLEHEPDEVLVREVALMEETDAVLEDHHPGVPSPWPCPDCDGVLWRIEEADVLRFRCRVGHAWSAESLLHEQDKAVEEALWAALRSLEDRADLGRTLAERAKESGRPISAERFLDNVHDVQGHIDVLRRLLQQPAPEAADER